MNINDTFAKAVALQQANEFTQAKELYSQILDEYPDIYEVLTNLSLIHFKENNLLASIKYSERALLAVPKDGTATRQIGNSYLKMGNYHKAFECYSNCKIDCDFEISYCLFALWRYEALFDFAGQTDNVISKILLSIAYFQDGNFVACKETLSKIDNISLYNSINEKLFKGFAIYLLNLITFRENNPSLYSHKTTRKIYLIGDSNCLSPSFTCVNIKGVDYECIPNLISSCQARRLSESGNMYSSAFDLALNRIPPKSKIIIIVGSIDTNPLEGILKYQKKINNLSEESINSNIDNIVNNYIDFCLRKTTNFDLIICGISKKIFDSDISSSDKAMATYIKEQFNLTLKNRCHKENIPFIDTYSITGYEGQYIDGVHLIPSVFLEAFKNSI